MHTGHRMLKGRMHSLGFTAPDIAKALGCSVTSVSNYMCGLYPWSLDAIYTICHMCNIPLSEIPVYFERSKKK